MTKTRRDVENLKADGKYFEAGALAADLGLPCQYGCHYGMRSDKAFAMNAFGLGFAKRARETFELPKKEGAK